MLAAYADESGHSKDQNCRFVGLAGFVADVHYWGVFHKLWQVALDEFNNGEEFHAKEFYRRDSRSKFASWPEDRKQEFIGRLADAIDAAKADAWDAFVSLDDYEQLDEKFRKITRDPYYIAFQEVTKGLSLRGAPIMNDDFEVRPVSMVYAYQEEYGATSKGRAAQLWHTIRSDPKGFEWASWMGTYECASARDSLPLQAADLFAYELTREFERWRSEYPGPMRYPLKRIIKSQKGALLIRLYERHALLDMLWNSGAFTDSVRGGDSPLLWIPRSISAS